MPQQITSLLRTTAPSSGSTLLQRRDALRLGAALAGGFILSPLANAQASESLRGDPWGSGEVLPVSAIEQIVGAQGSVTKGVLDISIARNDVGSVTGPLGVTFTPEFEIHGDLYFQPLGPDRALLNGDMALLADEVNPFIAKLISEGLVFQAYHQHLIEMNPQIWFVHFRGVDTPTALATKARAAIAVTRTPLPQTQPQQPSSPLNPSRLANILHGEAQVGEQGVVTVTVKRVNPVKLGGVIALPDTGVSTTIEFKPLGAGLLDDSR